MYLLDEQLQASDKRWPLYSQAEGQTKIRACTTLRRESRDTSCSIYLGKNILNLSRVVCASQPQHTICRAVKIVVETFLCSIRQLRTRILYAVSPDLQEAKMQTAAFENWECSRAKTFESSYDHFRSFQIILLWVGINGVWVRSQVRELIAGVLLWFVHNLVMQAQAFSRLRYKLLVEFSVNR